MAETQALLAVLASSPNDLRSRQLADQLQLPLADRSDSSYRYFLHYTELGLALTPVDKNAGKPFVVDLVGGQQGHRRLAGIGELLIKAIGGPRREHPSVVDATAGFGSDSLVLASWGYRVSAMERCHWVHALLENALQRARQQAQGNPEMSTVLARITLHRADAIETLRQQPESADVVYIDPMFPETAKTAQVKKPMRSLQTLLGPDPDAELLWSAAMAAARHRVVVKRALKAPTLGDQPPAISFRGKAIRFDVYSKRAWPK